MNILIFSWRGPNHPNAGGAEISTHEHAKGWVKKGHNVTLFTAAFKGGKPNENIDGVEIIRKGFEIFGVQIAAFKWYMFSIHPEYDVVIDEFHGIPFFTPLYVTRKKLGFIHEVAKEVWSLNPWPKPYNLIPSILGTLFEPLIFKLFYKKIAFMTVSNSTKEDLIKWGIPENNITVIHNGITVPKIPKKNKQLNPTIMFLGALSKDKGIEEALQTFAILSKKDKNLHFWIVGKGENHYLERLKKICDGLEISRQTIFFGFVKEEKKYDLLSRAHILINTSIREGWGLVIIEAAAMKVPTIAFNSPGLRDSIIDGKTGILCKENNVEELATLIEQTLSNKELLAKLSMNAYFWSKKFNWKKASLESLKLIESLKD